MYSAQKLELPHILGDEAQQLPDEQFFVRQRLGDCTEVASAKEIARQFLAIIRERQADALDDWHSKPHMECRAASDWG